MDFFDKVKSVIDKGLDVSRDAISRAGSAVQDFGDKSVVRIEKKQLEMKKEKEIISLGSCVYDMLVLSHRDTVSASDESIAGILEEITRIEQEIAQRADILKKAEEAESTASSDSEEATDGTTIIHTAPVLGNPDTAEDAVFEHADDSEVKGNS